MELRRKSLYRLAALVSGVTFLVYLASLFNDFVNWDDYYYVYTNDHIRSLDPTFFKWAFFSFHVGNWHPLTWISHALDYAVWGLNPLGHHLTSALLHALNTFLVVTLVAKLARLHFVAGKRELSAEVEWEQPVLVTAVVTGLLFGIHPLHVESVAWISERKDLLCGFFFLLSVLFYSRYASLRARLDERGGLSKAGTANYLLCFCFAACALASKPMAVTLPLVFLILDWYPLGRMGSLKPFLFTLLEKVPFVVLSLISSRITLLAQQKGMALMFFVPLKSRLLVAIKSLALYLCKMVLPLRLSPFYPYPNNVTFSGGYLLSLLLIAGVTVAALLLKRRLRVVGAAWCYFLVTMIPVIGIVQVGDQSMADRYTYIPSLGPFVLIASGAAVLAARRKMRPAIMALAAVVLFLPLAYLTVEQIGIWRNSIVLWSRAIEVEPGKIPLAYYNRGLAYQEIGDGARAVADYTEAIALNDSYEEALLNRGITFGTMGFFDKTVADCSRVIAIDPGNAVAYLSRGAAWEEMGETSKAIDDYQYCISLNRGNTKAYAYLGALYLKSGLLDRAEDALTHAIALNAEGPQCYSDRGRIYFLQHRYDLALADFSRAIAIDTGQSQAYFYRGSIYLKAHKRDLAAQDFSAGCDLKNEEACNALRSLSAQQ